MFYFPMFVKIIISPILFVLCSKAPLGFAAITEDTCAYIDR